MELPKKGFAFYKFVAQQALKMPYYAIRASKPVWLLTHKSSFGQYRTYQPNLSPLSKRILHDLQENGIAFTHIDEFFDEKKTLPELQKAAHELISANTFTTAKDFLRFFLRNYGDPSDLHDPIIRYLLHPQTLEIASAYFQMYARLTFFSGNIAIPRLHTSPKKSQNWHRDGGIRKLCKVFIYLNDVNEASGPFTYIVGTHPTGKWKRVLSHRFFGQGSYYPSDKNVAKELRKYGIEKNITTCVGRAGTMIFCDTLGLHRGGYATERERIMLTGDYDYIPLPAPLEIKFSLTPNLQKGVSALHHLAQQAIKNKEG